MSSASDAHCARFTYHTLNRRAVAEIQRKVVKKWKQDTFSKTIHAKKGKKEIAAWRADLERALHTFNVRSVSPTWQLLITSLQAEITANIDGMVLSIHHNVLAGQKGANDRRHSVSATFHP